MSQTQQFIKAVGRADLARRVGVTPNAVTNAKSRGKLPSWWYPKCREIADELGIICPVSMFAFSDARASHTTESGEADAPAQPNPLDSRDSPPETHCSCGEDAA